MGSELVFKKGDIKNIKKRAPFVLGRALFFTK
jgi:hypothetical protein